MLTSLSLPRDPLLSQRNMVIFSSHDSKFVRADIVLLEYRDLLLLVGPSY